LDSLKGVDAGELFGWSVAGAGDFNKDGYADIIIGAPGYTGGGPARRGKVYVYSGLDYSALAMYVGSSASENLGYSVDCAGDINRDGFDDLCSAILTDPAGNTDAGQISVYAGPGLQKCYFIHLSDISRSSLRMVCTGDRDVDADGYPDVAIGAPFYTHNDVDTGGAVYIMNGATGALTLVQNDVIDGDRRGWDVALLRDVTGDGKADLASSAPGREGTGTTDRAL
jgi:hypothetical protein